MKLVEALKLANAPQQGPDFPVLLACGFTPLHLETALKVHLRSLFPNRTVHLQTGLYGDLPGTLESVSPDVQAVLVAIEWADLDPRLGWRAFAPVTEAVIADAEGRLHRIAEAIGTLATTRPVAVALPTLPLAPVLGTPSVELDRIEARLRELLFRFAASTPAVVVHPDTFAPSGHDLRSELMNGFPYTFAHAFHFAQMLVRVAFPLPAKKGLITDLDETLWSGVLGDDGPAGVTWDLDHKTQFYGLYQQLLNGLAAGGTLIAVASKNDEALVKQAFERSDLVLAPAHLFPIEAHWEPKAESVARILTTWNIGSDAVVFVDDNELELAQIRQSFPAIECILFRRDDPAFLRELRDHFARREVRAEDLLRKESIRQGQALRQAAAGKTLDDLLSGAEAKIKLNWTKQPLDPRALELVNKTNQFNLNGERYTELEWKQLVDDPATHLLVCEYEDRFGKLGKISVLAGREQGGTFVVEAWVLSCRAFSRRIEHRILMALLERWPQVIFRFEATDRNGPFQTFLAGFGNSLTISHNQFVQHSPPLFQQTETIYA